MPPMRPTFAAECPCAAQPARSGDDAGCAAVAGAPATVSAAALSRPLAPRMSAPRTRLAPWMRLIIRSPSPLRRPRAPRRDPDKGVRLAQHAHWVAFRGQWPTRVPSYWLLLTSYLVRSSDTREGLSAQALLVQQHLALSVAELQACA